MKAVITLIVLLGITPSIGAEEQYSEKREVLLREEVHRQLARYEKGKQSIKNICKVIELMRLGTDHLNHNGFRSLEFTVPAVDFILKSYGPEIVPLLVDYAISVEDVWLKRRAIYCIENLTDKKLRDYLSTKYGKRVIGDKLKFLINESESDEYPELLNGRGKDTDFYFPSGKDIEMEIRRKTEEILRKRAEERKSSS